MALMRFDPFRELDQLAASKPRKVQIDQVTDGHQAVETGYTTQQTVNA